MAGTVENTKSSGNGNPDGSVSVGRPQEGHVRISVAGYDSAGFYSHTYQYMTREQLEAHINHCAESLLDMMSGVGL